MRHSNPTPRNQLVSASALAQMAYCERRIVFDQRYGQARNADNERDRQRGLDEHLRFEAEGASLAAAGGGRRFCFIATCLFGADDPRTRALRLYRDRVLRRSAAGRRVVGFYYRVSPPIGRYLTRHPAVAAVARAALAPVADFAERQTRSPAAADAAPMSHHPV